MTIISDQPGTPPDEPSDAASAAAGAAVAALGDRAGAPHSRSHEGLPAWWSTLLDRLPDVGPDQFSMLRPPPDGSGRSSAVMILLADREGGRPVGDPIGADVLLLERAATLRSHAGQPAFPGGATDPGDDGPVGTALRESAEEVGLQASSVQIVGALPQLWLSVSNFLVTPVLGWWRAPHPVGPVDSGEVARVARIPIADLADPANRVLVRGPRGMASPAFEVSDLLVWGFTAGVLSFLLDLGGWSRPWDKNRVRELPAIELERSRRTRARSLLPPDAVG